MFKERYERRKKELLDDSKINPNNLKVVKKFLEHQEYKLKRNQGLSEVDERSYKTLYGYIGRIRNLNAWFKNKEWAKLTKSDIKRLIDNLEDGVIKNNSGKRYADRSLYYQMLQGHFFDLVKKSSIARDLIKQYGVKGRIINEQVKFIEEKEFRKIVDCAISPEQRCLLWLAFDVGENINSLLELEKDDFKRQTNTDTGEPEYLVILSKEKLKRSRTPRSEITNYPETIKFLDIVLDNLKPIDKKMSNKYFQSRNLNEIHGEDKLFKFGIKTASVFLKRIVEKSGVRCSPEGQRVTWRDLRSSMACDLLKKEWTRDEVNARLGHRPSSRIIDRYINYLALDRNKPKKKIYDGNLKRVESELERSKELSKLQGQRLTNQQGEIENLKKLFSQFKKGEVVYDTDEESFYEGEKQIESPIKVIKIVD